MADNNKNLEKTQKKSNAELRKMFPKDGADIGIENGKKIGTGQNNNKFTKK